MDTAVLLGLFRHALTVAGGAAVSGGMLTQDDLTAAVGAIVTLAGLALSVFKNRSVS